MPRPTLRPRERLIIEIPPTKIKDFVKKGARMVVFQKFLGHGKQLYLTLLAFPSAHLICFSPKPLPFIIQANGEIIDDSLLQKPPNRYHPS